MESITKEKIAEIEVFIHGALFFVTQTM
ncbi:hypothetical protein [Anaerovorax odorimutans]